MIYIKNTQRKINIDIKKIKKDIQHMLQCVGYPDFDISIWFTTNKTIQKYNKQYRKKNKPTDVISFPYHTNTKPNKKIIAQTDDDKNLGDIIISLEYIQKDAPRWNQTLEERITVLLVHSLCHLLGYDHITDSDYKIMQKEEDRILRNL